MVLRIFGLKLFCCNRIVVVGRAFSSTTSTNASEKFCAIIGSGPAGFYTAQGLFKADNVNTHVHIFEKLPVPFGLVRYGVAPDHPDVKNVIHRFTKTASHKNFRFFGNVEMGRDLTIADLRKAYDAVILCYGAESEKKLNVPGEDAQGVYSARSFVGWYNGLPNFAHLAPDLTSSTAVVIGHGNVAVDVARILLSPPSELAKTDITSDAVAALSASGIKRVFLVGRRGPLQAAFTTGEFRELINLPGVQVQFDKSHFEGIRAKLDEIPRPKKRMLELMLKHMDSQQSEPSSDKKVLQIEFFKSPAEIVVDSLSSSKKIAKGVRFSQTVYTNPAELTANSQVKVVAGKDVTYNAGLVVKSIGYRGVSVDPSLPFDTATGTIANDDGRVRGMPGVYCSGWIGRGPVGVIADTLANASHVAKMIAKDLTTTPKSEQEVGEKSGIRRGLIKRLAGDGHKLVEWPGWLKIDESEQKLAEQLIGKSVPVEAVTGKKPREKITAVDKMIEIALSHDDDNNKKQP